MKQGEDPASVKKTSVKWLENSYGQAMHEWAYKDIPRRIICEKVLRDETGKIPPDLKIYCFHAKVRMILFVADRFKTQKRRFTNENLNPIYGVMMDGALQLEELPEFSNLDRMKLLAEMLAALFEFARVVFYSVGDKVFFGDLTHYPGFGLSPIDEIDHSIALGLLWDKQNSDITFYDMLDLVRKKTWSVRNKTALA
ncbi:MAG: hypothetical protein ACI8YP_002490 [Algoriphagus sp.]